MMALPHSPVHFVSKIQKLPSTFQRRNLPLPSNLTSKNWSRQGSKPGPQKIFCVGWFNNNFRSGKNFLHVAINAKDTEAVLFLIQVRVDVNSRTKVNSFLRRVNIPKFAEIQDSKKLGISENFAIFYDRPSPKNQEFRKILRFCMTGLLLKIRNSGLFTKFQSGIKRKNVIFLEIFGHFRSYFLSG